MCDNYSASLVTFQLLQPGSFAGYPVPSVTTTELRHSILAAVNRPGFDRELIFWLGPAVLRIPCQQLEWLDGAEFAVPPDSAATGGQWTVDGSSSARGEAPTYHLHTREDEAFMLSEGSALSWCDDQEKDLS
jgi:mannose-6-phosphate isomerase-like protein (cupin superfamily)